eukprot:Hpha_TRINITY_DN19169_c0_g1::TRINITY_DN19169_c0_g1_i1::g.94834::m.94834/K08770/UBC; ubiquitin C
MKRGADFSAAPPEKRARASGGGRSYVWVTNGVPQKAVKVPIPEVEEACVYDLLVECTKLYRLPFGSRLPCPPLNLLPTDLTLGTGPPIHAYLDNRLPLQGLPPTVGTGTHPLCLHFTPSWSPAEDFTAAAGVGRDGSLNPATVAPVVAPQANNTAAASSVAPPASTESTGPAEELKELPVYPPKHPVDIKVEIGFSKTIGLTICSTDTVKKVKMRVQKVEGIPASEQQLTLGTTTSMGRELGEGQTLRMYVPRLELEGTTLALHRRTSHVGGQIDIFHGTEMTTVKIEGGATVLQLKQKYHGSGGMPVEQQMLVRRGIDGAQVLNNCYTMLDYGFIYKTMLQVFRRTKPRGLPGVVTVQYSQGSDRAVPYELFAEPEDTMKDLAVKFQRESGVDPERVLWNTGEYAERLQSVCTEELLEKACIGDGSTVYFQTR